MDLTRGQRDDVRNFLLSRGLAFKPLLDEMTDHISCDLEEQMNRGMSYEDAWAQTINALPEDHFILIQQDTMETINRRFNLSRVFTYVAMGSLMVAVIFKILHLRGADELLLLALLNLAAGLLTASVAGIYFNRDKEGSIRVAGVVAGSLLIMAGYTFKILHLRGADQLIIGGVVTAIVFMMLNTIHAFKNTTSNANLFSFLHDKYSPGIERFLLILTIPMVIMSLPIFELYPVLHILIIYTAALQFMALVWRNMETRSASKNRLNLILVIIAFVGFNIPMLGPIIGMEYRLVSIIVFNVVAAAICLRMEPTDQVAQFQIGSIPLFFVCTAIERMGWIKTVSANGAIGIIATFALCGLVLTHEKNSLSRTYFILSLAGFLLEVSTL